MYLQTKDNRENYKKLLEEIINTKIDKKIIIRENKYNFNLNNFDEKGNIKKESQMTLSVTSLTYKIR